jgi:hypothetical protein
MTYDACALPIDRLHLADFLLCYGEFGASEAASKAGALKCANDLLAMFHPGADAEPTTQSAEHASATDRPNRQFDSADRGHQQFTSKSVYGEHAQGMSNVLQNHAMALQELQKALDENERLQKEIARLNDWADGFSEAQLKERRLCEECIREMQQEIDRLRAGDGKPKCNHWPGQKRCGVCGMGGGKPC